jgi:NAD(P)-dependent dehydrogenase (short-subunit alcohol dehydrogenase family)
VSDDLQQTVPLRRIAEPEEIAAAAVWLCSPQASYVTGAVLVTDGGWPASQCPASEVRARSRAVRGSTAFPGRRAHRPG